MSEGFKKSNTNFFCYIVFFHSCNFGANPVGFLLQLNSSHFYSTSRDINVGASNQSLDSLKLSNYFFLNIWGGVDKSRRTCQKHFSPLIIKPMCIWGKCDPYGFWFIYAFLIKTAFLKVHVQEILRVLVSSLSFAKIKTKSNTRRFKLLWHPTPNGAFVGSEATAHTCSQS